MVRDVKASKTFEWIWILDLDGEILIDQLRPEHAAFAVI
jgi:hypothetical protein